MLNKILTSNLTYAFTYTLLTLTVFVFNYPYLNNDGIIYIQKAVDFYHSSSFKISSYLDFFPYLSSLLSSKLGIDIFHSMIIMKYLSIATTILFFLKICTLIYGDGVNKKVIYFLTLLTVSSLLNVYSMMIIRDHYALMFFLIAVYYFLKNLDSDLRSYSLIITLSILISALFRIEYSLFGIFILIILFFKKKEIMTLWLIIIFIILFLPFVYLLHDHGFFSNLYEFKLSYFKKPLFLDQEFIGLFYLNYINNYSFLEYISDNFVFYVLGGTLLIMVSSIVTTFCPTVLFAIYYRYKNKIYFSKLEYNLIFFALFIFIIYFIYSISFIIFSSRYLMPIYFLILIIGAGSFVKIMHIIIHNKRNIYLLFFQIIFILYILFTLFHIFFPKTNYNQNNVKKFSTNFDNLNQVFSYDQKVGFYLYASKIELMDFNSFDLISYIKSPVEKDNIFIISADDSFYKSLKKNDTYFYYGNFNRSLNIYKKDIK